jgi:hypothetical protein
MYPIDNYWLTCQFNEKNEWELFNILRLYNMSWNYSINEATLVMDLLFCKWLSCADLHVSLLCDISCVEGFVIYSNNIYKLVVMLQSILHAQHKHHEQIKQINKQKSLILQWASLVTTNVMLFILYKEGSNLH